MKKLLTIALLAVSTLGMAQNKQTLEYQPITGTATAATLGSVYLSRGSYFSETNKYSDSVVKYSDISNYYQTYGNESQKEWAKQMLKLYDAKSDSLNMANHKAEAKKSIELHYHIKLN